MQGDQQGQRFISGPQQLPRLFAGQQIQTVSIKNCANIKIIVVDKQFIENLHKY